ncbi:MAG: PDZ domain-containing protein, partial [Akkermansiaceae bacterium]|nr:PDZ domain-containing protein [Akkermansiaceae bacterium]
MVADFPADKAGIKRGDVIVKLGGRAIRTPNDLRTRVAQQAPGTQLQVTLWRNKELI